MWSGWMGEEKRIEAEASRVFAPLFALTRPGHVRRLLLALRRLFRR
jgi:hypothetical protein